MWFTTPRTIIYPRELGWWCTGVMAGWRRLKSFGQHLVPCESGGHDPGEEATISGCLLTLSLLREGEGRAVPPYLPSPVDGSFILW